MRYDASALERLRAKVAGAENGWRWLFLVNVPIGLVAMVAILRLVPRRPHRPGEARARLDVLGALLLGALPVIALLRRRPPRIPDRAHAWAYLALLCVMTAAMAFAG